MSAVALSLHRVEVRLGGRAVLRDLCLDVGARERVAVVGPNGAGKSTLLDLLLGLRRPRVGAVEVLGGPPPSERVGFVPQHPGASLLPWLTVEANVALPLRLRGADRRTRARAVAEIAARLDPERTLDLAAYPQHLSGGQQQLVAWMRGLVGAPRALVVDEPFSAMDAPTRARSRRRVRELCEAADGPALLMVTHDVDDVIELAHRAVVIAGRPARDRRSITLLESGARARIGRALVEARC